MKYSPGILERSNSNLDQFGFRVPKDLLQHFKGPWAISAALWSSADLRAV